MFDQLGVTTLAQDAIQRTNGQLVDGRKISVAVYQLRGDPPPNSQLYVSNINVDTTSKSLEEVFAPCVHRLASPRWS